MTTRRATWLGIFFVFVGGVLLNIALYVAAGAILTKELDLHRRLLEAQHSALAYSSLVESFHLKDTWADFGVVPIIGCIIGAYAGFLQRKRPALLALACLLPMFLYEITSQPVGTWSAWTNVRYFGMRAVALLLAIGVAASVRRFSDRRSSAEQAQTV